MSGFVVLYGHPNKKDADKMFKKIKHRGPYLSGSCQIEQTIMAQNYLKADFPADKKETIQIPVSCTQNKCLKICYDGQIGNLNEPTFKHTFNDGHITEEQLLLQLYNKYGNRIFQYLGDAIFAFVISNGKELFAARDLLGIKTLFYGKKDNGLYLASELKSLAAVTDDINEFPPGHYMDSSGRLSRFAELSKDLPEVINTDIKQIADDIRDIIKRSIRSRVDFSVPTAALLSGGMDSSVIGYLANEIYKENFGADARLKTFAIGVGESGDIQNARIMSRHIGSDHHELIVNLEQVLEVLPEVIYYLESFDPSLVRSSVSNYLISGFAKSHGIELLLSGEGGDEVFCGYNYLKDFPAKELYHRQIECLNFLHNNASLRLDRMNQCHSVRVVAPLISGELLNYSLRIPPEFKQKPSGEQKIEKWIFRKAYEDFLPEAITWRSKQEFSQGSGSAAVLSSYFDNLISDEEFVKTKSRYPMIRSKEELYYFHIFTDHFGADRAVETVGQWILL